MLDREALIREIAAQNGIRGFDASPLERDKVLDFTTKLSSLLVRQTAEVDRIQVRLMRAGSCFFLRSQSRSRTKSFRVMPLITKSPGNCMRVWKDTNNNEQATAAESYVFCTLL